MRCVVVYARRNLLARISKFRPGSDYFEIEHNMKQAAHVTEAMSSRFGSTRVKMTKAAHTEFFSFVVGC